MVIGSSVACRDASSQELIEALPVPDYSLVVATAVSVPAVSYEGFGILGFDAGFGLGPAASDGN